MSPEILPLSSSSSRLVIFAGCSALFHAELIEHVYREGCLYGYCRASTTCIHLLLVELVVRRMLGDSK